MIRAYFFTAFKISLLLLPVITCGCAELQNGMLTDDLLRSVQAPARTTPDEQTVAAGLKEALRVGAERTVAATSKTDGFLANQLIHIALPEQFNQMARTLRKVGLGSQVDALETGMNRAAERAAGEAKGVFWDAITQMTMVDAYHILNGGESAATGYFRERTADRLRSRFHPIVAAKMQEVGLYQLSNQAISSYNALPFVTKPAVDLESYVTEKALDGLFKTLALEEKRIRQDPAARSTELLRRVFGK